MRHSCAGHVNVLHNKEDVEYVVLLPMRQYNITRRKRTNDTEIDK